MIRKELEDFEIREYEKNKEFLKNNKEMNADVIDYLEEKKKKV